MKEKVVLKSARPEEYGDLVVECRVIPNEEIGTYLATIPEERKIVATKKKGVKARLGVPGETIHTVLTTVIDGKEYILSEESATVKEREQADGTMMSDIVVTNIHSTSNEEYVVKAAKFADTYYQDGEEYMPQSDPRLLTQVSENVIIITSWGAKAVCLAGGFIVTYDASKNDYNTLEAGAFASTYEVEQDTKKLKLS